MSSSQFNIGDVVYDLTFKTTGEITDKTFSDGQWLYKHTGNDANCWAKEANVVPDGCVSMKRAQWLS
jgi:hypothetical protein